MAQPTLHVVDGGAAHDTMTRRGTRKMDWAMEGLEKQAGRLRGGYASAEGQRDRSEPRPLPGKSNVVERGW